MNILINCPPLNNINKKNINKLGGIESLNLALAKKLIQKKNNVVICSNYKKNTLSNKIKNIHINKFKKNSKIFKFDVIISSNDASIFNYFPENCNKIIWLHNKLQIEKAIRKKQFYSIVKNKITAVFVSDYLKKITSNLYFFNKRVIINNFLLPNFENNKINYNRKPIFIWSVQRDVGLISVINMWINKIYPIYKDVEFYIYGIEKLPPDIDFNFLKSKNIHFKGRVSKDILKKKYNEAMGMICLGYDETFCLNVLEANACGLPILTLGKTALKNFVKNNYNGLVAKDINLLSKKITFLINSKNLFRNKLINNSYNYSKKFYLDEVVNDWMALFK